jgi:predicted GNAT family acetyltransferase
MMILHKEDESEGVFYLEENGEPLAEMVYTKEEDRMVIQHTEVDESLRGKNVGFQLVEQGVEYAREANLKIVPLCEFAKKVIESHAEFQDVL